MKKSFTLLEVVISITIFMIVLLFLYRTLDQTKHSNKLFISKQEYIKDINHLYNIILEDTSELKSQKIINTLDKNKNSRITFQSSNAFHNFNYKYITYMVSSYNKLVRIESKERFVFEKTPYEFYEKDNAYIDVLLEDIEYFEYNNNAFIIKQKDKERIVIKVFKFFE